LHQGEADLCADGGSAYSRFIPSGEPAEHGN
jgi:hypothetical protein